VNIKSDFPDFTRNNYDRLLKIAKAKFAFSFYTDFNRKENFILWRHDVDFSLAYAFELAKIEAANKVRSTYFLLLHSRFYNLLEEENTNLVRKIMALGHDIGIHFDSHYYNIQEEVMLAKYLRFEMSIYDTIFGKKMKVFSFHNTTPFTLSCTKPKYAGLINTYSNYFQNTLPYCSDSNGYWRHKRLENILSDDSVKKLQVLTHPGWWHERPSSPFDRVKKVVQDHSEQILEAYQKKLIYFGRKNIK